jgi:hypothetical protein
MPQLQSPIGYFNTTIQPDPGSQTPNEGVLSWIFPKMNNYERYKRSLTPFNTSEYNNHTDNAKGSDLFDALISIAKERIAIESNPGIETNPLWDAKFKKTPWEFVLEQFRHGSVKDKFSPQMRVDNTTPWGFHEPTI